MSAPAPQDAAPRVPVRPARGPGEITATWLAGALGLPPAAVSGVAVARVGSGQIGSCYRCELSGPAVDDGVAPSRVLVKLPTDDPGTRSMLAGAYRAEVGFYRDLAATVAVTVPRCHAATDVDDEGWFTLVLDDLAPAVQGDQLAGCHPDALRGAAVNLAGLHGPRWCDDTLFDTGWLTRHQAGDAEVLGQVYGPAVDAFLVAVGDRLHPETRELVRRTVPIAEAWSLARSQRFGLVHGDYRLDNLMFHPDPGPGAPEVVALDWQTLSVGLPARDLAYLLGTSLTVEHRRAGERGLVAAYHEALTAHGVTDHDLAECWEDYRFAMFQGVLVSVFGCAYGARSERGDAMFATMVERCCAAMRDLDTLALA